MKAGTQIIRTKAGGCQVCEANVGLALASCPKNSQTGFSEGSASIANSPRRVTSSVPLNHPQSRAVVDAECPGRSVARKGHAVFCRGAVRDASRSERQKVSVGLELEYVWLPRAELEPIRGPDLVFDRPWT